MLRRSFSVYSTREMDPSSTYFCKNKSDATNQIPCKRKWCGPDKRDLLQVEITPPSKSLPLMVQIRGRDFEPNRMVHKTMKGARAFPEAYKFHFIGFQNL